MTGKSAYTTLMVLLLLLVGCATTDAGSGDSSTSPSDTTGVTSPGVTPSPVTPSPDETSATPSPDDTTTSTTPGPDDTSPSPSDPGDDRAPQTIRVTGPDGDPVDVQGSVTIVSRHTLFEHEFSATAASGNPVEVTSVGPTSACSEATAFTEGGEPAVFVKGSLGDVCRLELHADGDDQFLDADVVVEVRLEAAYVARWQLDGPGSGCVEPGDELGDLVLTLTADRGLFVDFFVQGEAWVDYDVDESDDGASMTGITIDPATPAGTTISVRITAGEPGQSVGDVQDPDEVVWTVREACDANTS